MRRFLAVVLIVAPLWAQQAAAPVVLTLEQKEAYLKNAKVVSTKGAKKGITNTLRAKLSDGAVAHDASIQRIDEEKQRFETPMGVEMNFRDTYKFNIGAYRLGRLLGLASMIPPSVERRFEGTAAAWTWWVEDVLMDDNQRLKQKVFGPDKDKWSRQYLIMKVFDQLIFNTDRNQGNILYDRDWRLWMIDHGRAFRTSTNLRDVKALERCDRQLLANMKKLTLAELRSELTPYVRELEIKGILARRDKIVAFFEKAGEAKLYDFLPKQ